MSASSPSGMLESLESAVSKERDFSRTGKKVEKHLAASFKELAGNDSCTAFISSYLVLRSCLDEVISCMPVESSDDSCSLARLKIVEIETRLQFLKAHILRILSREAENDRNNLIVSGVKALFGFLPEVSGYLTELGMISGYKGEEILKKSLERVLEDVRLLSSEAREIFEMSAMDAILQRSTNLEFHS
jgi:hypothetical protein